MKPVLDAAMVVLAHSAASRYKRKCWWADREELEQTAWVAMLDARRSYDPQTGVPFEGYAWRAVINQLHAVVLRASAPVSAPGGKLPDLKGLYRTMLDEGLVDLRDDPCRVLMKLERQRRIEAAITDVLKEDRAHGCARDVLLGGLKPRIVAQKRRVPVENVYRAVKRVKNRIAKSYDCWKLWKEEAS